MLGIENREWFLAGATRAEPLSGSSGEAIEFELPYVDGSRTFEANDLIEQAYSETMQLESCKQEEKIPKFTYQKEKLQETIFNRRYQRGFNEEGITKVQFKYIMDAIHQPIASDCDEEVSIYVVVNRVLDMPLGLYKDGAYIKYGDFARKAGYLSL